MKKTEILKVKYTKKIHKKPLDGGKVFLDPEYDYVTASTSHVKRFNNALMALMGIDGCERNLMDWISDNMSEGNYITNNAITRNAFKVFYSKFKKKDKKDYTENTIRIAFQRLANSGLLVPIPKSRGTYLVNPNHYFKKDESDRIKAIRMMMEFRLGEETKITVETNEK